MKRGEVRPRIPFPVFAHAHLGITNAYDWQQQALWMLPEKPVSLLVCNGGGKSSVIVPSAVLGFLYNFPKGRVAVTSGSSNQLDNQLWPAIEQYRFRDFCRSWNWQARDIITPQGGFANAFSTDEPTRLEGWHEDLERDSPLLYIVDEAKSISKKLWEGVFKCRFTYLLICSSAGKAEGVFYDSQTKNRDVFAAIKVTYKDCPHITEREVQVSRKVQPQSAWLAQYFSVFDVTSGEGIIDWSVIHDNLEYGKRAPANYGVCSTFVDFAGGGQRDETAIARRVANRVHLLATNNTLRDADEIALWCVAEFKKHGLSRGEVSGDAGGFGLAVIQKIQKLGWSITPVLNGSKPVGKDEERYYANRGSQIWFQGAIKISAKWSERGGQLVKDDPEVAIPDDPILHEQLCSRRRTYDDSERLMAEPKKLMASRGVKSPDRADAVLGAIICGAAGDWSIETDQTIEVGQKPVFANTPIDWYNAF